MRITSLAIKNFKSISNLQIQKFNKLDTFIGKNNSGKSNILDAAMLFLQETNIPPNLFDVDKTEISLHVALENQDCDDCGIGKSKNELRAHLEPGQKKRFFINNQEVDAQTGRELLKHHTVHINTSRILLEHKRDVDAQIQSGDITIFFAQNTYQDLYTHHPEHYKKLLDTLSHMFPAMSFRPSEKLFHNISRVKSLADTTLGSDIFENDILRNIANLGSGYLQMMVLLLFLIHPRYSLVIIDEPENHLHIGLQKKLLRLMKSLEPSKHILISTHSPLFVTPDTFTALHRVIKNHDNHTEVHPAHAEKNHIDIRRLAQELNLESNEMLFADHVILVEGEADEILLKGLLERFYEGPKEVLVLAVHSNTNFKIYRDVLRYFDIPHTIMTDKDSLHGYVDVVFEALKGAKHMNQNQKIARLKEHGIYVLPSGPLERHYPRTYQNREDSKPLNALRAAKNISSEELQSSRMQPVLEVLRSV